MLLKFSSFLGKSRHNDWFCEISPQMTSNFGIWLRPLAEMLTTLVPT